MVWKITWGIWQIFTRALESLKIGTLMGFFSPKLKICELKIYRKSICHDNEKRCKIGREIDLSLENWHEDFDEFWPKHSKISKICTLMGCLSPKYVMLELRKVQRSYVWWHWIMMQSLKENWFVLSKMTWGIWEIFTRALESFEIGTLMGFFYPNLENV